MVPPAAKSTAAPKLSPPFSPFTVLRSASEAGGSCGVPPPTTGDVVGDEVGFDVGTTVVGAVGTRVGRAVVGTGTGGGVGAGTGAGTGVTGDLVGITDVGRASIDGTALRTLGAIVGYSIPLPLPLPEVMN